MSARVLKGTKQEIVDSLARMSGEVRGAIVFVEEAAAGATGTDEVEDIFAEMQPYEAQGNSEVDDSREAIYTRLDGE